MKAFRLLEHGTPGVTRLMELPSLAAGDGEVVVQVQACGVNHLDLWTEQGALPIVVSLPLTQGCEIAGRVLSVGGGVADWSVGDRVAVQSNLFCGACEYCRRGEESMCLENVMLGVQRDGGFAEEVLVPARALVRLPRQVGYSDSAVLSLAASTAMHMLVDRVPVREGDWVLVMAGASGVGSAAIQIARALGARVMSTGSTEAKRKMARDLGAEEALDPQSPDWPASVRRWTDKRGVDVVVEHLGGEILSKAFSCLARNGAVVTCGATTGREVTLNLWPFFVKQQRLVGSYGRNRRNLEQTLAWAAEGKLKPVVDSTFPLSRTAEALARLRSRQVLGKIVVEPFEPDVEGD